MSFYIKDGICFREKVKSPDKNKMIQQREAELARRQEEKKSWTREQVIKAGEEAEKLLFG